MGDTGGRDLIFNLHSVDANNERSIRLAETIPDVFVNLSAFQNPSNFDLGLSDPIKSAKVTGLTRGDDYNGPRPSANRYSGNSKPVYVQADILESHIGTGESTNRTSEFERLAKIIRDRGLQNVDDCGHIISRANGGKMIDYNLFPQDKSINRGIWNWGVETLVRIWLISQTAYDPMVRVRIRLIYPRPSVAKPDRPIGLHYHLQFYKRRRRDDKNETPEESNANLSALSIFIHAAIYGELPNESAAINESETKKSMVAFRDHLRRLAETMTSHAHTEIKKLLEIYAREVDRFVNPPEPSPVTPMSSNKPFSWWDLVPVEHWMTLPNVQVMEIAWEQL